MKLAIYIIYNIFYLAVSAWFLLYANTYLNSKVIPNSLRWKEGHVRDDLTWFGIALLVPLLFELAVIGYLNYQLNKWYVFNIISADGINQGNSILWATGFVIVFLLLFSIILNVSAYS